MASDDYVPEEWESAWLPDVDVREVIGDLLPASVDLDDPAWDDVLPECDLPKVRAAVRGLGDWDRSVVEKSVTTLWRLVCGYENLRSWVPWSSVVAPRTRTRRLRPVRRDAPARR